MVFKVFNLNFFNFLIRLPPEFLPVSGPTERWCASTLGAALLCSSRAGSDSGLVSRLVWGLYLLPSVEMKQYGFLLVPHPHSSLHWDSNSGPSIPNGSKLMLKTTRLLCPLFFISNVIIFKFLLKNFIMNEKIHSTTYYLQVVLFIFNLFSPKIHRCQFMHVHCQRSTNNHSQLWCICSERRTAQIQSRK